MPGTKSNFSISVSLALVCSDSKQSHEFSGSFPGNDFSSEGRARPEAMVQVLPAFNRVEQFSKEISKKRTERRGVRGAHASPRAISGVPPGNLCSARRRSSHARTRMLPRHFHTANISETSNANRSRSGFLPPGHEARTSDKKLARLSLSTRGLMVSLSARIRSNRNPAKNCCPAH